MGDEASEKRSSMHKTKILLSTFILLVLVIALFLFIKIMNGPAEGIVSHSPAPSTNKAETKAAVPERYDGKYISFSYPEHFSITPSPKNSGLLETINMYSNDHSGKQVAIGIIRESPMNDSGVNYRQAHPELYKKQTDSLNNLVYTKDKNGSEYTGFLVKGDLVASVSLSSTYTKDLSSDYKEFVKNWVWKQ